MHWLGKTSIKWPTGFELELLAWSVAVGHYAGPWKWLKKEVRLKRTCSPLQMT